MDHIPSHTRRLIIHEKTPVLDTGFAEYHSFIHCIQLVMLLSRDIRPPMEATEALATAHEPQKKV